MDLLLAAAAVFIAVLVIRSREQRARIRLLASHLQRYRIEKLMEQLMHNYMRALDEDDDIRRGQILELQQGTERELAGQVGKFAQDLQRADGNSLRVSRLSWPLPYITRLIPAATLDMRQLVAVHARGIQRCAVNETQLSPRDKAFRMTAEVLLFQHSCHWFCKSRAIASARMQVRHQTRYEQLLAAVDAQTRNDYLRIVAPGSRQG